MTGGCSHDCCDNIVKRIEARIGRSGDVKFSSYPNFRLLSDARDEIVRLRAKKEG